VTDANLILGRFAGRGLLNGEMRLDLVRARAAFGRLARDLEVVSGRRVTIEEAASGVLRVANANMERALRLVSIEHGHDPRFFTLVAFGGGGGLHAAALAEALQIPRILIPVDPGAFSALGVLLADVIRDHSKTVMLPLDPDAGPAEMEAIASHFAPLEEQARAELGSEGFGDGRLRLDRFLAIRYRGQSYELVVPATGDPIGSFHRLHQARYGHSDSRRAVEVVSVRLRAVGVTVKPELRQVKSPRSRRGQGVPDPIASTRVWFGLRPSTVPVFDRISLEPGMRITPPAILVEYGSTTILPVGWELLVDRQRNLLLTRIRGAATGSSNVIT
jgi:N-methylhydantoinase A